MLAKINIKREKREEKKSDQMIDGYSQLRLLFFPSYLAFISSLIAILTTTIIQCVSFYFIFVVFLLEKKKNQTTKSPSSEEKKKANAT